MSLERLGNGPFHIVEVLDPMYSSHGTGPLPTPTPVGNITSDDVWGRCACCGARLSWRVLITSKETGNSYIVGMTCASRAEQGIDLRKLDYLKKKAERREFDRYLDDENFHFWLRKQPHRKGWGSKSLLDDLQYCGIKDMAGIRKAWKTFQEGGAVAPAEEPVSNAKEALEAIIKDRGPDLMKVKHPFMAHGKRTLKDYATWILANRTDDASYKRALKVVVEKIGA